MSDFSTTATLDVVVDDRSLAQARDRIESAVAETPVTVEAAAPGGGSNVAGRDRARMRQLTTEGLDLDRRRNELLERLLETSEEANELRARSGGGGLSGGLGLGILGAAIGTIGSAVAGGAGNLVGQAAEVVPQDLIARAATLGPEDVVAAAAEVAPPAVVAAAAELAAGDVVGAAAELIPDDVIGSVVDLVPDDILGGTISPEQIIGALTGAGAAAGAAGSRLTGGRGVGPGAGALPFALPAVVGARAGREARTERRSDQSPLAQILSRLFRGQGGLPGAPGTGTVAATGLVTGGNRAQERSDARGGGGLTVEASPNVRVQGLTRREIERAVNEAVQDKIAEKLNENPVGL